MIRYLCDLCGREIHAPRAVNFIDFESPRGAIRHVVAKIEIRTFGRDDPSEHICRQCLIDTVYRAVVKEWSKIHSL